jgi:hypothetical protein
MGQEYLVEVLVWDHQRRKVGHRAAADIEDELVSIARLYQETGRRLTAARRRHTGAASNDADLVCGERLGTRIVDIAIGRDAFRIGHPAAGGLCVIQDPQFLSEV